MDFVAIDIETANSYRDSICSIGMVKVKNNEVVDQFYSLVNPETYFADMNTEIHGITKNDVLDQPTFKDIYKDFIDFIKGDVLVAHFSAFDMYGLKDSFLKYDLVIPENEYFCSYKTAKMLYQLPSYRLIDVASHFDIPVNNHHNALDDALTCANITIRMSQEHNLLETFSNNKYTFGNFKSKGFTKKKDSSSKLPIEIIDNPELADKEHTFYGSYMCFTGALQSYTRREIAQKVSDIGATFEKNVTKKTNYLVVGNLENLEFTHGYSKSSKMKKAEQLSGEGQAIEVLSEMDFMKLL